MQLFNFYYQSKLYRFLHTDFWLFELSIWLHVFARSLISVFIPILFLKLGYTVEQVMIFFFIYCLIDIPLNFLARYLVRKIGARLVIIVGSLALIAYFICFYNLVLNNWLLFFLMAFFAAIYDAFYWVAHIYLFMKSSNHDEDVAGDTSTLHIIKRIAGIIAPAIGAGVLIFLNQKFLIVISITILMISLWLLFEIKGIKDKPSKKQLPFRKFFKNWQDAKDYTSLSLRSIHSVAEDTIWPIFIFALFENIKSVAALPIIVSVATIIFTYFTGKTSKNKRSYLISLGSIFIAFIWILRLILENNIFYYVSVFLVGLFSVFINIPLDSNIFEKGEKKDTLSTAMYRNVFCMTPKVFIFGGLILMVQVFKVSFIVAAISMFVIMILNYIFILGGLKKKESLVKCIPEIS